MTQNTKESIARRKQLCKELKKTAPNFFLDLPKGLIAVALIMISTQLLLSNIVGVKGAELVKLEEEQNALQHEKILLESEISQLSSLNRIEQECRNNLIMKNLDKEVIYLENNDLASR